MPLPQLTAEQREQALAKAAEARAARAKIKASLKGGETTLAELLTRCATDEQVRKLRVAEVLRSLPGVGPVRAGKIMANLEIPDNRRLGGLGEKQRSGLNTVLGN
ncbi:integration host factor, actinobacterial type [Crossiella sp. CA-258035]|uniref:integration host factor, actinobacterial type n=1 Tax=Crossiella sp. CA-258035 TaxID=2981138 RepID=UPI0024BC6245|nr:integration host factor, actinobacterial type [Crossiella sp. CA-258035]WHT22658.1 integration host factor, actinobacterial type [Crossiella sp. CA-258035]